MVSVGALNHVAPTSTDKIIICYNIFAIMIRSALLFAAFSTARM